MKKLLLVSLCMLCLCVTQLYAQSKTVTGTVTAKDDGLPLPGVTVTVKGTTTGTQTDGNGKFSLNAPQNGRLVFSFIGYTSFETAVTSSGVVNVSLQASSTNLSEVVVTGALGQTRQKRDIGYAAQSLNNATVNAGNAVNIANGLQGKVSGLNVTTTNGGVFENVKINLRGIRSLTFYGNANFNYKNWANIEFAGRSEQTSNLDLSNYSYFYPSINASIVLSDALPFLKNSSALSYLKLRGGWNKTANADIAPYSLFPTFGQGVGFPYGSIPGYTANNTNYDRYLRPERITNTEVGFEAGFLRNRINLEATYFHSDNTDQIIPINVSSATGFTSSYLNAASFKNKGVEMDLGLTPLVDIGKVRINFRVNATYYESEVTQIYPGLEELSIGGYTYAGNFAIKGQPAFALKATDYVRDPNGRVVVSALSGAPTADPSTKVFGNTLPKWIIGLSPSVRWKGLSATALFEYKGGYYAYSDIGNAMAWTGVSELSGVNSRERFVFPNSSYLVNGQYVPNTSVTLNNPETFFTGVARSVASNYIINASAWRMRELNIGYDFPTGLLSKQKVIKAATIAFTARNLFLWVPKSNAYGDPDYTYSPAASNFGTGSTTGVTSGNQAGISDSSINPPTRTFGGTLTLTF
ncbi:carboxypeptidase-like regulatory domain-containing protein [Mucilaginibacter aquatilis]|uniref:TonB-dependent receptor n=1 Tax=Mucilaginibacter aquatilis TaxID=1517760 RepID=A0A6I4IBU4_9SPHI|nr:carboxypeptidase-like regulatory domain-containing protein [Mucilaginibacter aquatilis]MVN92572.1 TonB-dependent receptor [Mucilaginibacter aquatilis]